MRGYSFYGFSFVYVIFEDGTDPYWARSRVLEYLSSIGGQLPKGVTPSLGPDATGVGWAFMYSLNSTNRDLAELRSLQDWYLKYQLTSVPGVAEVASVGGFVKQYQVTVDPTKLRAYNLALKDVSTAIERSNGEVGGRSLELAEREFILRVKGYVTSLDDLKKIAVGIGDKGVPILLRDVATIQFGPDMRRGIAEANGEGETVGGIVVVRYGANARQVIGDVKARLAQAMKALPPDVKVTVNYDRTALIDRAVKTLEEKLLEESIVVALVCFLFLLHLRSALVAIIVLPVAVLIALLVMFGQDISSNIMSLGGIAIAIGAMVDAVIIMIENAHKHLERDQGKKPHWEIIRDAAVEVGPTLFYSLLVITVSFLPVFTLQEQEGRLFKPLAFTKTYSMAAAALLSITLAPVLMGWFIRGKIPSEEINPLNRLLIWIYHPLLDFVIRRLWAVIFSAGAIIVWVFLPWNLLVERTLPEGKLRDTAFSVGKLFPFQNIGSEFMPPLYEGDLLYMPTTFPGISPTKAREILQVTDRLIKSFPEVAEVFGKAGRAETATDPAPMDMIETTIRLKPDSDWPAVDIQDDNGKVIAHRKRTPDELTDAMNNVVQIPGLNNAWTMPIRTRIDMLSTGIKTPVGIKIAGADLATLERIGTEVEAVVRKVPGTASVFAERVMGGRFIEFEIDRDAIARYGLTIGDVQDVLSVALGGRTLTTTVEGLQRYAINLRYDRDFRSDLRALREDIVVPTPTGAQIPLGQLATVKVVDGPMGIKSEGAVPNAWVYVDIRGVDIGTYVQNGKTCCRRSTISRRNFFAWRLQHFLERPIRIHAARQGTADDRRAADAAAHHAHHLPEHQIRHQDRHRDARRAVLAGRRVLGDLFVRLQFERRRLGGHHRARRPRRRNRRGDAALFGPGVCGLEKTRRTQHHRRFARRDLSRRGEARSPESHDGLRHHCRPRTDFVEPRRGRGRDETHRHADGRRRHHLDDHGTGGVSGDLFFVAFARFGAEFHSSHELKLRRFLAGASCDLFGGKNLVSSCR